MHLLLFLLAAAAAAAATATFTHFRLLALVFCPFGWLHI